MKKDGSGGKAGIHQASIALRHADPRHKRGLRRFAVACRCWARLFTGSASWVKFVSQLAAPQAADFSGSLEMLQSILPRNFTFCHSAPQWQND
jgi:hypothetical protein